MDLQKDLVLFQKSVYIDDDTWVKVVKVLAPGIIKMKVSNVACVFPFLLSMYLNLHVCPSKLSTNDM